MELLVILPQIERSLELLCLKGSPRCAQLYFAEGCNYRNSGELKCN